MPGAPTAPRRDRSTRRALCLPLLFTLVVAGCVAPPRSFEAGPRLAPGAIEGQAWDAALRRVVTDGFVDYPALCEDPALESYLDQIARVEVTGASQEELLAFYINAYNAVVVEAVLEGGRPASLLGRARFFLRDRHRVAGESITLWDLENERLRPLGDSRVHFAIVCASASCPALQPGLFHASELDAQLDRVARSFVNDSSRNAFDPATGELGLSAIFDWFREDFEAEASSVAEYVARRVDDAQVARALREGSEKLRFLDYDWSLNGRDPTGCSSAQNGS